MALRGRRINKFLELRCLVASRGLHFCVSSTSFEKKYHISVKNWIFDDSFLKKGPVLVILVPGMIRPSGNGLDRGQCYLLWCNFANNSTKRGQYYIISNQHLQGQHASQALLYSSTLISSFFSHHQRGLSADLLIMHAKLSFIPLGFWFNEKQRRRMCTVFLIIK